VAACNRSKLRTTLQTYQQRARGETGEILGWRQGKLEFHGRLEPQGKPAAFGGLLREVRAKGWVVYSKRPFAGPQQVLAYLSRKKRDETPVVIPSFMTCV
jgi:hypothetical protein